MNAPLVTIGIRCNSQKILGVGAQCSGPVFLLYTKKMTWFPTLPTLRIICPVNRFYLLIAVMLYNLKKLQTSFYFKVLLTLPPLSFTHTHTLLTTLSKMRSHTLWEEWGRFISSYLSVPLFITASVYLQGPLTTALIFPALVHPVLLSSSLSLPHTMTLLFSFI